MSALAIGMLRDRVRLEQQTRTSGYGGTATITWSSLGELYARIETTGGREIAVADGMTARVTHRITIRFRSDIAPSMRFTSGARAFDIHAATPVGGHCRWLECQCEERVA